MCKGQIGIWAINQETPTPNLAYIFLAQNMGEIKPLSSNPAFPNTSDHIGHISRLQPFFSTAQGITKKTHNPTLQKKPLSHFCLKTSQPLPTPTGGLGGGVSYSGQELDFDHDAPSL